MSRRAEERGSDPALRRPSRESGATPVDRVRYHGARVLLMVALSALVTVLFPPLEGMRVTPYSGGMVAPEDVIAEIPFAVPKSGGELERERREATEAVPRTFDERVAAGLAAGEITEIINTPAKKYERKRTGPLLRPGLIDAVEVSS